ncbi:hypothetical protein SAMN04488168_104142 [Bacillus sp. 491mf]|nr:hypothetical protein SAMN04488168_104142 [Bacillus sp. 491mf]
MAETEDYVKLSAIDHEQHLSKRVGKPNDIAQACLYLTVKENDFVTGSNLVVDGVSSTKIFQYKVKQVKEGISYKT